MFGWIWLTILLLLTFLKVLEMKIVPPVEAAALQIILDRSAFAIWSAFWAAYVFF